LKLLIATRNPKKLQEIRAILGVLPCETVSLEDFPEVPVLPEEGASFLENAVLKARQAADATGLWALADDSGLEVEALDGAPGVRSKRFGGEETPYGEKMGKILELLKETKGSKRAARFQCVAALADPVNGVAVCQGACEGEIASEIRGTNGFGYDPIFLYPPLGKTFGELSPEEKNRVSHRAMALAKAKAAFLKRLK